MDEERFRENGADLVVIGSGYPKHFPEFREKTGYHGLLFTDPSLGTFSSLGFSKSLKGFISLEPVKEAVSAWQKGHRPGSIQGSTLQLGGAVVIDSSGAIRYFFKGSKAGDHPDVHQLLNAIEK